MSFTRFVLSAIVAASALSMGAAQAAGSVSGTFNVNLTVQGKCVISTAATDINFGILDMNDTVPIKNNSFFLKCTKGTGYSITLTPSNPGTAENAGKMKTSTGETIDYTLHSDSLANTAWGKTSALAGTSSASSSAATEFKVYAKVAGNVVPDVPVGTYTDAVTIKVTY